MLKQISKGVAASILVIALSLLACLSIAPEQLAGWGTMLPVAMVPAQIVISLFWGCNYPQGIARLPQPWKGLAYLLLTFGAGALVAWLAWRGVGGALPPSPFVNMYLILSVAVALWLVVLFQGWPFNRLSADPGPAGIMLWAAAHLIAYGLYRALFDFSFLRGAPVYLAALDPGGLYMAWLPLVFAIATVAAMLCLVLLDFWPFTLLAKALPGSTRQPWFGIVNGALTVLVAVGLWRLFIGLGRMDLVRFLVEVCVALVFGIFIVLVMLDGLPAIRIAQPWRGLALIGIAGAFAVAGFALYAALAHGRFALAPGQPGYALEMWIASAMLAVTFPAMVAFAKYFDCWPLARAAPAPHPAATT